MVPSIATLVDLGFKYWVGPADHQHWKQRIKGHGESAIVDFRPGRAELTEYISLRRISGLCQASSLHYHSLY